MLPVGESAKPEDTPGEASVDTAPTGVTFFSSADSLEAAYTNPAASTTTLVGRKPGEQSVVEAPAGLTLRMHPAMPLQL